MNIVGGDETFSFCDEITFFTVATNFIFLFLGSEANLPSSSQIILFSVLSLS